MSQNSAGPDSLAARDGVIDLGTIARALLTKKHKILVPTLAALLVAALTVNLIPAEYKSAASVILEPQESSFTRPTVDQPSSDQLALDDQTVQSNVQLLKSRDLAQQVVTKLSLVGNPEFDPLATGIGPVKRLLMAIGLIGDPFEKSPEDRVLDNYFEALSVYPVEKSRAIAIEFASRDPELAAKAANLTADLYIETQRSVKRGESLGASEALSPQIQALREKVAKSEAAVERFRAENGLFVAQNNASMTTQQLAEINTQLSTARAQQAETQAKAGLLRDLIRSATPIEISDVTNNELMRRLVEQRVNLKAQLALESRTLLPGHPRIKELDAQLSGLEAQIVAEAQKTVRSLENDAKVAGARVDTLTRQLGQRKAEAALSNNQEVELRALEREAKSQRDLLESYLSRFREASARASFQEMPADARIVSRAVPASTPYFPKKAPIILIATLAVLIMSMALVTAGELTSGRAFVAEEPPVGLPADRDHVPAEALADRLGRIGLGAPGKSAPQRRKAEAETAAVAAAPTPGSEPTAPAPARIVQESVEQPPPKPLDPRFMAVVERCRGVSGGVRSVLITGVAVCAAISEKAAELGRHLASEERRVVLVDLKPGRGRAVGVPGLGDLLSGEASFVEAIQRDRFSALHLIVGGAALSGVDEATTALRLEMVFKALSLTYDVVLFDAGAVSSDLRHRMWTPLIAACELCLVVVPAEGVAQITAAERQIGDLGAREIIVVEEQDGTLAAA
jgi:uncharacterized protein involved in exopolysaccharide biosynthesis